MICQRYVIQFVIFLYADDAKLFRHIKAAADNMDLMLLMVAK